MGQRGKMALPAGISPAAWRFEAARSNGLSYGSKPEWSNGLLEWWIAGQKYLTGPSSVIQNSTTPSIRSGDGADGETRTPVGRFARQFTKLLLSLLSHAGVKKWGDRLLEYWIDVGRQPPDRDVQ